jgi:glyoxylase I family protein
MRKKLLFAACCLGVIALGLGAGKTAVEGAEAKPVYTFAAVRYQVKDVDRSVTFYTEHLGFVEDTTIPPGTAFGAVKNGALTIWLSGPKSSGSRPLPDGRAQEPGGWNRIALQVENIEARVEELKKAGLKFRNEIVSGPGGKQIQIEDPDGNPIELFEPAQRPAASK